MAPPTRVLHAPKMHPVVRAALAAAMLSALSAWAAKYASALTPAPVLRRHAPGAPEELSAVCPPGTLPDYDQCIPIPAVAVLDWGAELVGSWNAHREKSGRWTSYENIPRLPGRPTDYNAYRYPIPPPASGSFSVGPYDLDRPNELQRRGAGLTFTGHGGVDLMQSRGVEVHSLPLEHQQGDALVVFAGPLFGISVVTRHAVRESGRMRDYVVLHGHLDGIAPGIKVGDSVREGGSARVRR